MARSVGTWALCLVALCGCTRPSEETSAGEFVAPAAPVQSPPSLQVGSLQLGDRFDEQTATLDGVATVFHPETEAIYAVGRLTGVSAPGRLTGRWEHLDSGVRLAEVEESLGSGDLEFWFSVTRPTGGWPAGEYKFYLALNGEDVAGAPFEVSEDAGS